MKPEFVWDLSTSARWAHTPLTLKGGIWLGIMDAGPLVSVTLDVLIVFDDRLFWSHHNVTVLGNNLFVQIKLVHMIKWWCWMVFIRVQASVRNRSTTKTWLCCSLRSNMLPRCAFSVCHVFVLVLCLSSAEDFDWAKNNHGSFYYGTFPAGKHVCIFL